MAAVAIGLGMVGLACSPALNWREVRLHRLTALLPCKPDSAQRTVHLGGRAVTLNLVGCEAAGGLFALTHAHLADPGQMSDVLADWRATTLANMQSTSVTEVPFRMGAGVSTGSNAQEQSTGVPLPQLLQATGKRPDGSPLQARLAWFAEGADLFHMAVYATQVAPDMADPLFTQAKLQ